MYKLINRFGFLLLALLVTTGLSSGRVQAHELEAANGYTAVLHIDPDDSPSAGEPTVLNFLIGKNGASYNQNDYSIRVEISADGVETRSVPVEPAVFGNAADGDAKFTFPVISVYTIELIGQNKQQPTDKFRLEFTVRVADAISAASIKPAGGRGLDVLILSTGSLLIVGMLAYRYVGADGRYAPKPVKPKSR